MKRQRDLLGRPFVIDARTGLDGRTEHVREIQPGADGETARPRLVPEHVVSRAVRSEGSRYLRVEVRQPGGDRAAGIGRPSCFDAGQVIVQVDLRKLPKRARWRLL